MNLKIEFKDCWQFDNGLPEDVRWLAALDELKIVVTAPTKDKAFEEVMKSIRVKVSKVFHSIACCVASSCTLTNTIQQL